MDGLLHKNQFPGFGDAKAIFLPAMFDDELLFPLHEIPAFDARSGARRGRRTTRAFALSAGHDGGTGFTAIRSMRPGS